MCYSRRTIRIFKFIVFVLCQLSWENDFISGQASFIEFSACILRQELHANRQPIVRRAVCDKS